MGEQRRGYWRRREIERKAIAAAEMMREDARRVQRLRSAPDGWTISDAGNLVTTRHGLTITVYQHQTQGWSFIRSSRTRSYARHGFKSRDEATAAALKLGG